MGASLSIPVATLKNAARLFNNTNVKGPDDCWIFQGSIDRLGYGSFRLNGRIVGAHRAAFELVKGACHGLHVMHKCDVRQCVNPNHLELGTHADNMADCASKGRSKSPRPGNGHTKITAEDSAEIARLADTGVNYSQIARAFGVTAPTARYHHRKHTNGN